MIITTNIDFRDFTYFKGEIIFTMYSHHNINRFRFESGSYYIVTCYKNLSKYI